MCVMESKTRRGLSLIELTIAVSVLLVLAVSFFIIADPVGRKAETRDLKRISDIAVLDRVMSEFFLDNERYPDASDLLRTSTSLPTGGISLGNSNGGWILENVSTYTSHLPIDPLNDEIYFYSYYHESYTYELNARLEAQLDAAQNDGGNDPDVYEIGNYLELISP